MRMAFDNLCVIFPRRGVTGGGWEFGILAPLHQITPHTAWAALFWALFLLIYISSLMPPHLFLFSFSINFPGSLQIATNVQIWQMQTKCKKIWAKNEGGGVGLSVIPFCVLASYVWVRFPRFCRLPTRRTDTLHSPANTLGRPTLHTHLQNVWNIKQGGISGYHI